MLPNFQENMPAISFAKRRLLAALNAIYLQVT